ncbi:MAG: metalloregulator ArsR/SmtB family transcription factor [Desulfamplus sp.]|nr:metalloregulator ArsR/SmtB family transcription factor [Desulfamplus sp.]
MDKFKLLNDTLGHPTRIKIVKYLREMDRCICGQIVEIFPYSQSTISQHLKLLKESGIVSGEVDGPKTCYCINKELLERIKENVSEL